MVVLISYTNSPIALDKKEYHVWSIVLIDNVLYIHTHNFAVKIHISDQWKYEINVAALIVYLDDLPGKRLTHKFLSDSLIEWNLWTKEQNLLAYWYMRVCDNTPTTLQNLAGKAIIENLKNVNCIPHLRLPNSNLCIPKPIVDQLKNLINKKDEDSGYESEGEHLDIFNLYL